MLCSEEVLNPFRHAMVLDYPRKQKQFRVTVLLISELQCLDRVFDQGRKEFMESSVLPISGADAGIAQTPGQQRQAPKLGKQ